MLVYQRIVFNSKNPQQNYVKATSGGRMQETALPQTCVYRGGFPSHIHGWDCQRHPGQVDPMLESLADHSADWSQTMYVDQLDYT